MTRTNALLALFSLCAAVTAGAACRKDRGGGADASVTSVTAANHPSPTVTVQPRGDQTSQNMERVAVYEGLSTPTNAFHDPATDRYLISNAAGHLTARDGNGFISAFSPAGTIAQPRWIVGGAGGVTLDAPKGLVVVRDLLYVADIDTVRVFDARSGAPRGKIDVPGAVFLAGMACTADGRVLVADAGVRVEGDGSLRKVGDGAIWTIDGPSARPAKLVVHGDLGGPAALFARPDGDVLVATLVSGKVYRLGRDGTKHDELATSRGRLDGIVQVGNKIYISSWDAGAVYRRIDDAAIAVQLANLKEPGGLALDAARNRLVVPILGEDRVDVFTVR